MQNAVGRAPMRFVLSFSIPVFFLAGACRDDDAGPPMLVPHEANAAALEACRATAVSICSRAKTCGDALVALLYEKRESCETEIAAECASRYEGPSASGAVLPCASESIPCEALEMALNRDFALTESPTNVLLRYCPIAPGQLDLGETCLRNGDCKSGACLATRGCGHCAEPRGEGASCEISDECAVGLHCFRPMTGSGRCTRMRMTGQTCTKSEMPCAWGTCAGSVCRRFQGLGERCDEEGPLCNEASGLACASDLTCQPFIVDGWDCEKHLLDTPDPGTRACPWHLESTLRPSCVPSATRSSLKSKWQHCVGGKERLSCEIL
jgi:hypothetical protein